MSQVHQNVSAAFTFLAALFVCISAAWGQKNKDMVSVEVAGKVAAIKPTHLVITPERTNLKFPKETPEEQKKAADVKGDYLIGLDPKKSKVTVAGQATRDFLRPGQIVAFSGKLDLEGNFIGEIAQINVLPPDPKFMPETKFEVPTVSFVKDLPKPKNKPFDTKGKILASRRGTITVMVAPNKRANFPVALDADVRFTTSQLSPVKEGDAITVKGKLFQPGKVIADTVTITLTDKIGETKKPAAEEGGEKPAPAAKDQGEKPAPAANENKE